MDILNFSEEHHDALVKARTALGNIQGVIEKFAACGADCSEKAAKVAEYDQILSLYKQHFMGHLGHG